MLAHGALIAFIVSTSMAELNESCSRDSCAGTPGVVLLQSSNQRSKNVDSKAIIVNDVRGGAMSASECVSLARTAPLDAAGYDLVKQQCCFAGMTEFIVLLAGSMGYEICNSGFGPGLASWHGCEGPGATQTFSTLQDGINAHSADRCTSLSTTKQCTKPPADCPDFSGLPPPPQCGCSLSKINANAIDFGSATVTQSNLGGVGPSTGAQEIRYEGIGRVGSQVIDLVVEVLGGTYQPDNPVYNGKYPRNMVQQNGQWQDAGPGKFGAISLKGHGKADFKFTFVKTKTSTEIQVEEFVFTFLDFDFDNAMYESIELSDFAGYVVEDDTALQISRSADGLRTVFENRGKDLGGIPGPYSDPMSLTQDQRRASVMFFFKKKSSFQISGGIAPYGPGGAYARSILLSTSSSMADHCAP